MIICYFCTILPYYFCTILPFYYATSVLLESAFWAVLKKSTHFCESFTNFCFRRNYSTFLHEKQASFREDFRQILQRSCILWRKKGAVLRLGKLIPPISVEHSSVSALASSSPPPTCTASRFPRRPSLSERSSGNGSGG